VKDSIYFSLPNLAQVALMVQLYPKLIIMNKRRKATKDIEEKEVDHHCWYHMIFSFSDSVIRKTRTDADIFEIKRIVTYLDV
jgi:hypothetical protein